MNKQKIQMVNLSTNDLKRLIQNCLSAELKKAIKSSAQKQIANTNSLNGGLLMISCIKQKGVVCLKIVVSDEVFYFLDNCINIFIKTIGYLRPLLFLYEFFKK